MKKNIIWIAIFVSLFVACGKDDQFSPGDNVVVEGGEFVEIASPTVFTSDVTDITTNSAKVGCEIIDDGGLEISKCGVCISKKSNPTIDDYCLSTSNPGSSGPFTYKANGLSRNTIYYVRAYAINREGISYGECRVFKTDQVAQCLYYDDGQYYTSIGTGNQYPMYWGVSFPTSKLKDCEGLNITKVSLYVLSDDYYSVDIMLYQGGSYSPGNWVSSQRAYAYSDFNEFVDFKINNPVKIDVSKPLWVVFKTTSVEYPASACDYVGNINSDWYSTDGNNWYHLSDEGLDATWMIRVYLEDGNGKTAVLDLEN